MSGSKRGDSARWSRRRLLQVAGGTSVASAGCLDVSRVGTARRQSVPLEFVDVAGVRSAETFRPLIERLEDRHDATIEFSYTEIPYENIRRQLLTRIAGTNAPDIAAIDQIWLGEFVDGGALIPLDEVADDVGFGDFLPAFADVVNHDSRTYGIPTTTDVRGLYWDKRAFEAAGLDPERPPRTWSELLDFAHQVHDPPERYGAAYLVVPGRWAVSLFGAGGQFLDSTGTEPRFDDRAGVAAATFLDRLYNRTGVSAPEPPVEDGAQLARAFLSGQYALSVVEGSWLPYFWETLGGNDESMVDRFGFAPTPTPDGDSATMSGGHIWAGFRSTDSPEIVADFLKIAAGRQFGRHLAIETGQIPTRQSLLDDAEIWDGILYGDVISDLLPTTRLRPVRHWPVVERELSDAIQQVAYDRAEPQGALSRAADRVRSAIDG